MRKKGWKVLKVDEMSESIKIQTKREEKKPFVKEKRKNIINKMR